MGIGVTLKVKKFEIDPFFAKKSYSTKTDKTWNRVNCSFPHPL